MQLQCIYANSTQEESAPIEIDGGEYLFEVIFAANGEYIVGGGGHEVGVWRVEDGTQMATMATRDVCSLAASKDGRWIAAGTENGELIMWDAKTFEEVFSHGECYTIPGVDFSPDSTRLVNTPGAGTTTVWNVATRKEVLSLDHDGCVLAARYSPQGDRIATASEESVRVWDSNNGRLLVDIPVKVTAWNAGLLWSVDNNHLFVVSGSTVKQFEASTGSTVSEWLVPGAGSPSCIVLPKHGGFIACSTKDTVTFWNTSTHTQLGLIQQTQPICSTALSPDGRFLAIVGKDRKITIRSLPRIIVSIVFLWIMVHLNNILVHRVHSHCLVCIPLSRNLTSRSTTLRSIHGSTTSSRTRTRY